MRTLMRTLGAFALIALLAAPAPAAPTELSEAKVTYVTSSTVYVDAGSEAGLRKGDAVQLYRNGELVATLEVTALSSKRASCRSIQESAGAAVGDLVRFRPHVPAAAAVERVSEAVASSADDGSPPRGSPGEWLRAHGVRGRVGVRYLGLFDRSGFGGDYSQPALDLRLDATLPRHPSLRVSSDVRARRTYRDRADGESSSEGHTRVYQLYGEWSAGPTGFHTAVGRQHSISLSSIGVFDGVDVEYRRRRWKVGLFSGTQPNPVSFGYSTTVREHGAYVEWRQREVGYLGWRLALGPVASYQNGEVNRESLVLQGRYLGGRLNASVIQEIDLNRSWKSKEESILSFTSSFLSTRYRLTDRLSIDGGFDTRRNVRLYRDRVTPETEFDDSYRRGYWGGVDVQPTDAIRLGASARRTAGGSAGSANTATFTARTGVPSFHDVSLGVRSSAYRNNSAQGWLHALSVGADLGWRARVELTGGLRDESDRRSEIRRNDLRWYAIDVDYRVSRALVLLLSLERSDGNEEEDTQLYSSMIYHF